MCTAPISFNVSTVHGVPYFERSITTYWSGAGSVHQMDISSNTPKVHGRILWANPVTISHFLGVPHYYWGVGRPEWVSGTTPTTAPCSPSGWQFYLYVGYRTTLAQSPNQCQIDWWLNDTFLLSCYLNTHNSLWELKNNIKYNSFPIMSFAFIATYLSWALIYCI